MALSEMDKARIKAREQERTVTGIVWLVFIVLIAAIVIVGESMKVN